MGTRPHLSFCVCKNSVICTRIKTLYGFQLSPVVLCIQNSDFRTRITSLCRWIDPTCGFCMQNSDFWTRITSLYGTQTSPVISVCKTACLASEILVSMSPSPHVWFLDAKQRLMTAIACVYGSQTSPVIFCMQNNVPSIRITSLYGSQPSSVAFACKTATFGPQ